MFMTTPGLAEWMPESLRLAEDIQYWRAVMLTTQNPWFLVVYRSEGLLHELRTLAVSWESRLLEVIQQVGLEAVLGISRLSAGVDGIHWQADGVDEVWLPASDEIGDTGPMLLKMRGEEHLKDSFMAVVKPTRRGRTLLLRFGA